MKSNQSKVKEVSLEFGNLIKQRREDLGYTIKKVASAVHSSESYISRIESHKRTNPSVCIVYGLAEVLEIELGYLLGVAFPHK
ncbi:helix-turn-helix domain-containing protein [Niallia sp. FSL W8-0954]|uniref:helix-turn-helix domain-containing protein n=1 Tax=Niallia sp. FSL W8-0954 TaxID=2975338 RepID=UPI0030F5C44C